MRLACEVCEATYNTPFTILPKPTTGNPVRSSRCSSTPTSNLSALCVDCKEPWVDVDDTHSRQELARLARLATVERPG